MTGAFPSEVVRVVCAVLSPFIAVFGLYVIAHGHYGPGGGFAGGVLLAVSVILVRLTLDEELAYGICPVAAGPAAGSAGLLLFLLVGALPLFGGGAFLDYAAFEIGGLAPSRLRYLGILVVEIGVGAAVFGAMVTIFDVLTLRASAEQTSGREPS